MSKKILSLLSKRQAGFMAALAAAGSANASTSGGSGLPWESGLQMLTQSLQGPVAKTVIVVGVVVAGLVFVTSGAAEGTKKLAALVLGASIILGGVSMISSMFGAVI